MYSLVDLSFVFPLRLILWFVNKNNTYIKSFENICSPGKCEKPVKTSGDMGTTGSENRRNRESFNRA